MILNAGLSPAWQQILAFDRFETGEVNRARESLEKGADINDVVYECGFSDLSHLNRRFKPCFGMTPKQYQQLVFNS